MKTCKDCAWFIPLPPDEGACAYPMGGRNYADDNDPACEDFEPEEKDNELRIKRYLR